MSSGSFSVHDEDIVEFEVILTQQYEEGTEPLQHGHAQIPSDDQIQQFQKDGYAVFPEVFSAETVKAINYRLELVLRGHYNTGSSPDKSPKLIKTPMAMASTSNHNHIHNRHMPNSNPKNALGYSGNKRKKVLQIINIHKADSVFRKLVTTPLLGKLVAKLMKWEDGARLCQDQVWAKPPGAPPLAYHRDSPYFMFDPNPVATVWIALDDMTDDLGPLTYVRGSHLWGDGRVGSSQNFFQDDGGMALLYSAARREGIGKKYTKKGDAYSESDSGMHAHECQDNGSENDECSNESLKEMLKFESMSGLLAGGLSIHDGRTWHGSSGNKSDLPRRGIGLHFVRKNVKWTESAIKSGLWRKYVKDTIDRGGAVEEIEIDEDDFPLTWVPE